MNYCDEDQDEYHCRGEDVQVPYASDLGGLAENCRGKTKTGESSDDDEYDRHRYPAYRYVERYPSDMGGGGFPQGERADNEGQKRHRSGYNPYCKHVLTSFAWFG